jgi:class 3 adenylate cyclase/pimeloyl-ACP methyl ester carboxylesterase
VDIPEIGYAKTPDGVHLAYQVLGDAPLDLVFVHGFIHNLRVAWELPLLARYYRRLASFSRLILFDRRGCGLSDRVTEVPTLEMRMDDIGTVMDATGSSRSAIFGSSEGGPTAALFAATYPERTAALIMYGTYAKGSWAPDYPWGETQEELEREILEDETNWGSKEHADRVAFAVAPDLAREEAFRRWWLDWIRLSLTPADVVQLDRMGADVDVRDVLPTIHVPTLVLHKQGDEIGHGRFVADHIPGATFVELPGAEHSAFIGATDLILDEIAVFLTGTRSAPDLDRVLATVLFTDIVGSTEMAARLGDTVWKELVATHDELAKAEIERHRGTYVHTTGDGLLATFDGPARAVRCAQAFGGAVRSLGFEIRSGCHTGEIELASDDVRGIAVHIGARVAGLAGPSEVLVSSTVKDLVAGSGLAFEDRGEHELKGVPDRWHLYRVAD